MAWQRDDTNLGISGATAYSYTEVNWSVDADRCTYRHIGGVTSPYYFAANATSTLQWWESGTWHDYAGPTTHYFGGYGDQPIIDVNDSFVRTAADRSVSLGCYTTMMGGGSRAWIDYTVPHLAGAITSLTATRVSDNQVNLAWTNPATAIDGVQVQASIDGAAWSTVATLSASSSYQYTQSTADHSYKFRVRATYIGSSGSWSNETAAITMSPAAPQSITTAAAGGTTVTVTLTNTSPVATSVEYQVSTDGGSTWGTTQTSANLTSFTATVSGTGKIRVRNVNSTGSSAWLVSGTITTITPPAAPTLTAPAGSIIDLASGSVDFEWTFNSLDGSAQTAYEFSLSKNGGAATTSSGTTAKKVTQSLSTFSAGDTITVKVRTKGADANWGAWSATKTYNVYSAPTVSITSPSATVTGMPISLAATYSDMAGFTCQYAHVSLTQGGRTLFDEDAEINGTAITASLDMGEFLPANGESYTVVLDVRSSSGLQSSANATFTTAFTEPAAGSLSIVNDETTGYASLMATFDNSESDVDYSGATNSQFDTEAGYVKALTVEGQSEVQNGSLVSIESVGVRGRNLIEVGTLVPGYLNGTTTLSSQTSNKEYTSDYIPVTAGEMIRFDDWANVPNATYSTWMAYQFFNANKGVLGNRQSKTKNPTDGELLIHDYYDIEVPSNAAYIRVSARFYNSGEMRVVPLSSADEPYYPPTTITVPLRSAGSVHDQLQVDKTDVQVARKVGYVDLGSLTWNYASGTSSRMYATVSDIKPAGSSTVVSNILCAPFKTAKYNDVANHTEDNIICTHTTANVIWVYATSYGTDAAAFKTAMNGVYLFYELTTPTTDTLSDISLIQLGTAATVLTDLDSTFTMTGWDGSADAVSISVARVNADGLTPLITDGASGAGAVDKYAPLNKAYQYAVTTKSSANAVKTVYVDNIIETDLWFAYWGENIASAKWNPDNGGIQLSRPQKTRVYYAGRKDPVSYDGAAVALSETPSWMLVDRSEVQPFVQLIEDGGRGVYKSCDGWVYHADFDLALTPKYTAIGYYGGVQLSVTRIAGEQL